MEALFENRLLMAVVVVAGVPLVLVGYILLIEKIVQPLSTRWANGIRPWLWLAPGLTFLGVFLVYPMFATILRSFKSRIGDEYVGFENYTWFFDNDDALTALRNNVLWVVFMTGLTVGLGLLIAVLVDRVRYESSVKSIVFLPLAISFVAAGVIWKLMYDRDVKTGTLNAALTALGKDKPVSWISDGPQNNFMLIFVGVWMLTGFAMVILSAGLKGISTELLEAASLDGANAWQTFRLIVVPLLAPTIAVVATTMVIIALKMFDIVYVMTSGNFGTEVMANLMIRQLFNAGQQGRAAAVAVVLLVAIIPVMIINIRRFRQQEALR